MSFSSREFRDALGCFATGITIISLSDEDGVPRALTANSFSSVSLEPPLVLWCLGKDSDMVEEFARAPHFGVSVLEEGQANLSQHFAQKGDHAFAGIGYEILETGAPLLKDALAAFDCVTVQRIEAGDHWIYLGEVKAMRSRPSGKPLLYVRSRYGAVAGD